MAQKVDPYFGNPGEDPILGGTFQKLQITVDALMRWAKLVEGQLEAIKSIIRHHEQIHVETSIDLLSSIEAICHILKESDIDLSNLSALQNSFQEKIMLERQKALEALEQASKEVDPKPKIWTPDKRIVPGK